MKFPRSDQPSRERRYKITQHDDQSEAAVDRHHDGIIQQIRHIARPRRFLVGKQPAEVRVDKASDRATFVADMGAVWIARLVSVGVVLAMVRHPVRH